MPRDKEVKTYPGYTRNPPVKGGKYGITADEVIFLRMHKYPDPLPGVLTENIFPMSSGLAQIIKDAFN